MDPVSIIIGIFFLALFIVPFIIMSRKGKKSEKQLLQTLAGIAEQHKCKLSQHEISGDFGIGLDEKKNFVFFCKNTTGQETRQAIDLAGIQLCRLIKSSRTVNSKEGKHEVIERLELGLIPTAKDRPEVRLEFFNAETGRQLNGELQSVENWSTRINARVKIKK
ncbi:MAG: hypothetical protein IH594_13530 [Bacteroidales bacterium]|nr:hypothetical protein [Bacteroidales bacterium]